MYNRKLDRSSIRIVVIAVLMAALATACSPPLASPPGADDGDAGRATVVRSISGLPSPSDNTGYLFYVQDEASFYYSDGNAWITIDLAGPPGPDGVSIAWLGSLATYPADPSLNEAFYHSSDRRSYIWDGDSWEILAQDGTSPTSQNLSAIVPSGSFLALSHGLNRNDLTFTSQFLIGSRVYDTDQYRYLFPPVHETLSAVSLADTANSVTVDSTLLTNGQVAVVWGGVATPPQLGVYAMDGSTIVAPTTFAASGVSLLSVTQLSNGHLMIAFGDRGNSQKGTFVILDADGTTVAGPTVFADSSIGDVAVSGLAGGGAAIGYTTYQSNEMRLYHGVYDNSGAIVSSPVQFDYHANQGYSDIRAVSLSGGGYALFGLSDMYAPNIYSKFGLFDSTGSSVSSVHSLGGQVIDAEPTGDGGFGILLKHTTNYSSQVRSEVRDGKGFQVSPPSVLTTSSSKGHTASFVGPHNVFVAWRDTGVMGMHYGPTAGPYSWSTQVAGDIAVVDSSSSDSQIALVYSDRDLGGDPCLRIFTKTRMFLERVSSDEVRLWNFSGETLEMVISLDP